MFQAITWGKKKSLLLAVIFLKKFFSTWTVKKAEKLTDTGFGLVFFGLLDRFFRTLDQFFRMILEK
jgi:hypothetical protein